MLWKEQVQLRLLNMGQFWYVKDSWGLVRGIQQTGIQHVMDVSENSGTPKSSILISFRFPLYINHPFWGTPIFETTHNIFVAAKEMNRKLEIPAMEQSD